MIWKFIRDESAATSIEYCFIAGLISIVVISGALSIGRNINAKFYGPLSTGFN